VPDVVGNRSAIASQRLQNAGFEVNIQTVISRDVPTDRVATQDPQPGQKAKAGSTVTIIVSKGPGDATVPGVLNQTEAEAVAAMRAAGFKTQIRRESSDTIAKGHVISTSPPENSQLEKGRTVVLIVSSGPPKVSVPGVVGKSENDARNALEGAGLKVSSSQKESADKDPGTVLSQSPNGGATVRKGSTVDIVVAKAPPPVDVPDVTGKSVADATKALQDAGLKVRRVKRSVDTPDQDGKVQDQNPAGGEQVKKGSKVTIGVGKFNPPLNPEPNASATPTPSPTTTPVPTP
jgi:serine/threonine-protein kinase